MSAYTNYQISKKKTNINLKEGEIIMKLLKKQNIEYAQQLKDVMLHWNQLYKLLIQEFKKYHTNNNIHIVGYKIELVDKLYNCHLRQDNRKVAYEIIELKLDSVFGKKSPEVIVQNIATIHIPEYKKIGYVFASKYCHFHYPSDFPIFDQHVRRGLSKLTNNGYSNQDYAKFKKDLDILISKLDFKITYEEIDTFLWIYGQWVLYKKKDIRKKSDFSNEFYHLIENHKEILEKLDAKFK